MHFAIMLLVSQPLAEQWISDHTSSATHSEQKISDRSSLVEADGVKYVLHGLETPFEGYMMKELGDLGLGPKVLASFPEENSLVMEYIETPTITPEVAQKHCKEIGATLRKVHSIPLFKEKGVGVMKENQVRVEYIQAQAARYDTDLSKSLLKGTEKAMKVFEEGMESISALDLNLTANVHTDPHPRNLFWTDRGFLMIDWESSSHGHPYFDVASIAIFLAFDEAQEKEFLEGYFGRAPTSEELQEYALVKKTRWAYTYIVNAMWAFRVMEKEPSQDSMGPPDTWYDCMQSFASTTTRPPLKFFVDVAQLSLQEAL